MKEAARGPPGAPVYETRRGIGRSLPPSPQEQTRIQTLIDFTSLISSTSK